MKKLLGAVLVAAATGISGAAFAADLPVKAVAAPLFNWTGFYGGINGGYSWGKSRATVPTTPTPTSAEVRHDGGLASVEGGYCYQQIGAVTVACLELRYDFPKEKGSGTLPTTPTPLAVRTAIDPLLLGLHYGFLTDRNQQLWYAAGGLAFGEVGGTMTGGGGSASGSEWKTGWYVGLGTERMIDQHWSWKLEYDYVRITNGDGAQLSGTRAVFPAAPGSGAPTAGGKAYDNILTVGINYHFGTR